MLSAADLKKYALDCYALEANDATARSAFMALLRDAKKKCGSWAEPDRISVQIFPSLRGGCELFVTAVSCGSESGSADVTASIARKRYTYGFSTLDALLGYCACLRRCGKGGESFAYFDPDRRKYYLCSEHECFAAGEFGFKLAGDREAFLREHCRLLTDNAIEVLSALA